MIVRATLTSAIWLWIAASQNLPTWTVALGVAFAFFFAWREEQKRLREGRQDLLDEEDEEITSPDEPLMWV